MTSGQLPLFRSSTDSGEQPRPEIAVVIPILNEAETLGATLQSLVAQDYSLDRLEVYIVDGGSTDGWQKSLSLLERAAVNHQLMTNPRRSAAAAVNTVLQATDAPIVLWISGHCVLAPDYITTALAAYREHRNTVVGGRLQVLGDGVRGKLNALLLRSRFGTGFAQWRRRAGARWANGATYALFDRQCLLDIGGLDERLIRNQDNDLMVRLRNAGTRFMLVDADATYLAPATLADQWRRAWGNGSWLIWSWRLGLSAFAWYHFAPMAAVLAGLILAVVAFWSSSALYALLTLAILYAVLALGFSVAVVWRDRALWALPAMPLMFFAQHFVYGLAEVTAFFRRVPDAVGDNGHTDVTSTAAHKPAPPRS